VWERIEWATNREPGAAADGIAEATS